MTEPGTARIAVDLLGGDHAPAVVVDGALRACQADPALQLLLVGPLEAAESVRSALPADQRDRIHILATPAGPHHPADLLTEPATHEPPAAARPPAAAGPPATAETTAAAGPPAAARSASTPATPSAVPDSSDGRHIPGGLGRSRRFAEPGVRAAVLAVAQGLADAVVSAGDTGAIVTSAALSLGRLPGIRRPPLAAVLPSAAGRIVLLDVGSSVDPDPETLAVHARLGAAYAATVHGVAAPRVGLLTIGTEPGKGDRLRRTAPELLAGLDLPGGARYVGPVEGNDVVTGAVADVVVTDGFAGNVLLKGLETAYAMIGPPPVEPGTGTAPEPPPRAAVLLGVGGLVVVCHGAASGVDVAAGISLAARLHRRGTVPVVAGLVQDPELPRVQEVVHEQ